MAFLLFTAQIVTGGTLVLLAAAMLGGS